MRVGRLIAAVAVASFLMGGVAFTVVAAPTMHLGAFSTAAAKPTPSPNAHSEKAKAYCDAFLSDLAGKLHTSVDNLRAQAKAAIKDQIDKAVANKDLTADQASKLKARVDAATGCQGLPNLAPRPGFGGFRGGRGVLGGFFDAVASALQVSTATLQQDLKNGDSLSQVNPSVSKTQFDTAFRAALGSKLDSMVTAGKLTKDQETKMIDRAVAMADNLWDHPARRPHFGMPGNPGGPGGPGAPAPQPSATTQ